MITGELREYIIKLNKAHDEAERYLQQYNCHICQHAIFTNGVPAYSHYVGTIGNDYDLNSIKIVNKEYFKEVTQ